MDLIHYADALSVLRNNEILFNAVGGGFTLSRGGKIIADMDMGPFSAPFLNKWMSSTTSGFSLFPLGFSGSKFLSSQGVLGDYSASLKAEASAAGLSGQEADAKAVEVFLSNEIVATGTNSIFKMNVLNINSVPRADFEDEGQVSFLDESEDEEGGDDTEEKIPVVRADRAFYHVVKMEKKGRTLTKLPKIWVDKIAKDGLSWEFVDGLLYVANTVGAARGLPPAPDHLCGLANLDLSVKDAVAPVYKEAPVSKPVSSGYEGEEWHATTLQFLEKPCLATFGTFRDAEVIAKAYNDHKKDPGYKMGSNKNPLTDGIRKVMRGEDKAITWDEFVELLGLTARPNDVKGKMILLFKIRLYVAQTEDGKVYVSE